MRAAELLTIALLGIGGLCGVGQSLVLIAEQAAQ